MLYLMVGGPWHGTWKEIDPERFREREIVRIPDPPRRHVFEEAVEFGVPRAHALEDMSSSYYLHRFESRPVTIEGSWDAYLDAVVWVGLRGFRGDTMMDALVAAIDPNYMTSWSMP